MGDVILKGCHRVIWRGYLITVLYLDCEDVLKFKELYTSKTFLYDNLGNKINKLKIQSSVLFIHSVTLLLFPPKKMLLPDISYIIGEISLWQQA